MLTGALFMTRLSCNDQEIPLNGFTQRYIANMIIGIARSFGDLSQDIAVYINDDDLRVESSKGQLNIEKDFAKELIQSTIKGILSPLKGIFWRQKIKITVTQDIVPQNI